MFSVIRSCYWNTHFSLSARGKHVYTVFVRKKYIKLERNKEDIAKSNQLHWQQYWKLVLEGYFHVPFFCFIPIKTIL